MLKKNATTIGEKYPKLIPSVKECRWCETVWEKLYRGEPIDEIGDSCEECGRCVVCCGDDVTCKNSLAAKELQASKIYPISIKLLKQLIQSLDDDVNLKVFNPYTKKFQLITAITRDAKTPTENLILFFEFEKP